MKFRALTMGTLLALAGMPLAADATVELGGGLADTGGFRGAVRWLSPHGWGLEAEVDATDYDDTMLFCCETTYDRLQLAVVHRWEESGFGLMAGWFDTTLETTGLAAFKLADSGFFGRAFYTLPLTAGGAAVHVGAGAFAYDGDATGDLVDSRDGTGFSFDARLDVPMSETWSAYASFASGWQPDDYDATANSRIDLQPQALAAGLRWQASEFIALSASWRQTDFRDDAGIGYDEAAVDGVWLGLIFLIGSSAG